ncbi:YHYH protein [Archangium sp.]|uniref:YHYH protein n=1 Tax=Archangium sp. TaxID=1872627 RepID=UPI002D4E9E4A|nr:YHYH protein [Archangium sp.]HYO59222.1 YHYH protein [Archangium sp.]
MPERIRLLTACAKEGPSQMAERCLAHLAALDRPAAVEIAHAWSKMELPEGAQPIVAALPNFPGALRQFSHRTPAESYRRWRDACKNGLAGIQVLRWEFAERSVILSSRRFANGVPARERAMETKRCGLQDEGRHLARGWLSRLTPWAAMVGLLVWGGCKRNHAGMPADAGVVGFNPAYFLDAGLAPGTSITTVPCTLTGDAGATCYSLSIRGAPADHPLGRYCPRSITDGADAGGLWVREGDGKAYEVSGDFIAHLADFYDGGSGDGGWQMFDPETGRVHVTDTKEACLKAAKIDVPLEYHNHCVECTLDDVDGGKVLTFLVPTTPVKLEDGSDAGIIGERDPVGVALNGVVFDSAAPLARIIETHNIAPFDHCGGHVSPASGYHYHGAAGCSAQVAQSDGHAPLIGYALDGYAMHAMRNEDGTEPEDLDDCRGHNIDEARGYHYHVADIGENAFIGCFHGRRALSQ